jgi:2-C-methyl-D-erythritol 4-phosphate cytidylyltransferase
MAVFSVLLLTASPPHQAAEAGGAFVKVDGREALLRSIELFLNRDEIKQLQLVVLPEELEEARRRHGGHLGFSGVKMIGGGPRWMDQMAAAADAIAAEATHVLVHDAARPVVPYTDIDALLETAPKHPIVTLVTPMRGPLVEIDEGGNALAYHSADRFMQLLTPRVFEKGRFLEMVKGKHLPHASEMRLLKGSPLNMRLGGPGDASLAKSMLRMMPRPKPKGPMNPFEEAQW